MLHVTAGISRASSHSASPLGSCDCRFDFSAEPATTVFVRTSPTASCKYRTDEKLVTMHAELAGRQAIVPKLAAVHAPTQLVISPESCC